MFIKSPAQAELDEVISEALREMKGFEANTEDYTKMVSNVDKLVKLRQLEKPQRVSNDTLAVVLGNLLGILIIVKHEQLHVVTSKALGFVLRSR